MLEVLSKSKQDLEFFVTELNEFDGIGELEILEKEEKIYDNLS